MNALADGRFRTTCSPMYEVAMAELSVEGKLDATTEPLHLSLHISAKQRRPITVGLTAPKDVRESAEGGAVELGRSRHRDFPAIRRFLRCSRRRTRGKGHVDLRRAGHPGCRAVGAVRCVVESSRHPVTASPRADTAENLPQPAAANIRPTGGRVSPYRARTPGKPGRYTVEWHRYPNPNPEPILRGATHETAPAAHRLCLPDVCRGLSRADHAWRQVYDRLCHDRQGQGDPSRQRTSSSSGSARSTGR